MNELVETIADFMGIDGLRAVLRAGVVFIVGLALAIFVPRRIRHLKMQPQQSLIVRSALRYGLVIITVIWTLSLLGIDLSVLFGAAGILTVALGFASQASASNLISGLFLMFESHFVVGDIITVGDITGEVTSIDPLSVKVRTFQNLAVRIPNETMLKANVTNLSGYPVRRYDMRLMVGHGEDLAKVTRVLHEAATKIEICLQEPKPLIIFQGWEERGLSIQFSVWATRVNYLEMLNRMHVGVRDAFAANDIEVPVLRRDVNVTGGAAPVEPRAP